MLCGCLLCACIHLSCNPICLPPGQQQLLCCARVLLRNPQVLVLDECTAHMDPANAAWMQQVLEQYQQAAGCSMLQIAHQVQHIVHYDRVLVMEGGCVVEQGAPQVLLEQAGSVFAGFVAASGRC